MPVEKQIAIIYCGTMALLRDIPVSKVNDFENEYLEMLELKHPDVLDRLGRGIIDNEITEVLEKVAAEIAMKYKPR
jgi:F-type H+-transporting ATPase subunit alpha